MDNNYQVQVGRRGVITFPKEIRDQENIVDGEILNLIMLSGDVYVISRRSTQIAKAARELAKEWGDSGETLESMLSTLREVRADYDQAKS